MQFIRPPIRTICVGQAFGTAAMLLSLGQKGKTVSCYLDNFVVMDFFLNNQHSRKDKILAEKMKFN